MSHAAHQAIARRRLSPPTKNINRCGARPRLVILGDDAIIRAVLRVAIPMLRSERPVLIVQNAFRRTGNIFILTAFQRPEEQGTSQPPQCQRTRNQTTKDVHTASSDSKVSVEGKSV